MNNLLKTILKSTTFCNKNGGRGFLDAISIQGFYYCTGTAFPWYKVSGERNLLQYEKKNFSVSCAVRTRNSNRGSVPQRVFSKLMNQRKLKKSKICNAIEDKQQKFQKDVENALEERRLALTNTRRKIQEKGKLLIQDIKETKEKMKEKFEEVIERENIYTIPNLLCVTRIGLSPFLGYLIISHQYEYALLFMTVASVSDWIDGWIARNYKSQSSKIGSFLDPMADKVLIGTLFLTLTYVDLIPVPLTCIIIGRDITLIICGFVIRYKSLPSPKTLSRYFDATLATAQLAPTFISKVNTGIQLVLVASTLAAPVYGFVNHQLLQVLRYVTAASTVAAACSYIFSKETYLFLKNQKAKKKKK